MDRLSTEGIPRKVNTASDGMTSTLKLAKILDCSIDFYELKIAKLEIGKKP